MATLEIEEAIKKLEEEYKEATDRKADIHTVNRIWRRINDLKAELKQRGQQAAPRALGEDKRTVPGLLLRAACPTRQFLQLGLQI